MAIKRYEWQGQLCTITELAEATGIRRGFDLWEVIRLKMEYNKSRPKLYGRAY